MPLEERILLFWYAKPSINWFKPFTMVMSAVVYLRKWILKAIASKLPVPVVVVGNITLGGTGKTPVILQLAKYLQANGHFLGFITII